MFHCKKCNKCFTYESSYIRHLDIASNCKIVSDVDTKYICDVCHAGFSDKYCLDRHHKSTKNQCFIIRTFFEKFKDMKPLSITNHVYNDIVNSTTNNNTIAALSNTTNTINNILFAKHGEECVKHITREVVLELLNMDSFTGICTTLMKDAYFNRTVPKNHSWCLVYPNNEKAAVMFDFDKNKFEREMNTKVIDEKFANLMQLMTPVFLEIIEEEEKTGFLNTKQKRNLFRIKHFCNVDELSAESTEIYESVRKMAFKEKSVPMKTWIASGLEAKHLSLKFKADD